MGRILVGRAAFAVFAAAALAACAGGPRRPPPPIESGLGSLMLRVTVKGRNLNPVVHHPDRGYIVRVLADKQLDVDHPIPTGYAAGGFVFAFNLPPGRYAPLLFSYDVRRVRYVARLEPALALQWAVEVRGGEMAFMGDNFIRREWLGSKAAAWNAFKHVVSLLPPWRRAVVPITIAGPRVDRGATTEGRCLREVRTLLAGTPWVDAVELRLREIGNPPDPIVTGLIRKRAVKARRSENFSYQETLDWSQPRAVRGGLEWREPKGRARIAVTLMRPGDAGWKTPEEFLRELRSAGSGPEDTHGLLEVALSSRTGLSGRYTSYVYPEPYLVGSKSEVYVTETILVPAGEGYYLVRYRALRDSFPLFYPAFRRFVSYLDLSPPPREDKT